MSKDFLIDANLDIIKAELVSMRIERNKKSSPTEAPYAPKPVSQSPPTTEPAKTPSPPSGFLRNKSTRLHEIIESFNNYEKRKSTITSIKPQPQPPPQSQEPPPETATEKPTTFTSTYNIFAYTKDFTDTPIPNNFPLKQPPHQEDLPTTPKVDGLISYFSSRNSPPTEPTTSKRPATLIVPSSPTKTRHSSPFKVNYHLETPSAARNTEKSVEAVNPVVTATAGRLDTDYYNKIFHGPSQENTTTRQNAELSSSPDEELVSDVKATPAADQLTMSVDSLEASSVDLKELSTEADKTASVLDNPSYNSVAALSTSETVYDLATFGLDSSVVQGELEPIYKPIVLQKRSKNQGPGRKRTFANMIWPMSAEEERIMRSNSPFIVPEVVMESAVVSLKSCLKRNVVVDSVTGPGNVRMDMVVRESSGNKRVGFGEKLAFVSVFERFEPEVDLVK